MKARRSSRLALSEPNDEAVKTFNLDPDETQQISQLKGKSNKRNIRSTSHEGVSGEIVVNATTEFKSKRRRVNACRSANSSYRNDSHGHARFFGMHASSPFDLTEYTEGFSKHDKCSRGNALQVPEYVCDIFQRLFLIEVSNRCVLCFRSHSLIDILTQLLSIDRPSCKIMLPDCIRQWITNQNSAQQCA